MNVKLSIVPQLSLLLLFTSACSDDSTKYVYIHKHNQKVVFKDVHEKKGKDLFVIRYNTNNNEKERLSLLLEGDFNKDSVDVAVKKYLKHGVIPLKKDLY